MISDLIRILTVPTVLFAPSSRVTSYIKLSRLGTSHPISRSARTLIDPVASSIAIQSSGVSPRGLVEKILFYSIPHRDKQKNIYAIE